MASWQDLESEAPGLAAFGAERLRGSPTYLATVRADGRPRVHPVTPIIAAGRLFVFMEPTSPKGRDLRERGGYAIHNGVPDSQGTGGEFWASGVGHQIDDPDTRSNVAEAASYTPADRYLLFELGVDEARCNGYGDVALPDPRSWNATSRGGPDK